MKQRGTFAVLLVVTLAITLLASGCSKKAQPTRAPHVASSATQTNSQPATQKWMDVKFVDINGDRLIPARLAKSTWSEDYVVVQLEDTDVMRHATTYVGVYFPILRSLKIYSVCGISNGNPKELELEPQAGHCPGDERSAVTVCRSQIPDITNEVWQGQGRPGVETVASMTDAAKKLREAGECGVVVRGDSSKFWFQSQRFQKSRARSQEWPSVIICGKTRILRVSASIASSLFSHTSSRGWNGYACPDSIEIAAWPGVINILTFGQNGCTKALYGFLPDDEILNEFGKETKEVLTTWFVRPPLNDEADVLGKPEFRSGDKVVILYQDGGAKTEGTYAKSTQWWSNPNISDETVTTYAVRVPKKDARKGQVAIVIRGIQIMGVITAITDDRDDGSVTVTIKHPAADF